MLSVVLDYLKYSVYCYSNLPNFLFQNISLNKTLCLKPSCANAMFKLTQMKLVWDEYFSIRNSTVTSHPAVTYKVVMFGNNYLFFASWYNFLAFSNYYNRSDSFEQILVIYPTALQCNTLRCHNTTPWVIIIRAT